MVTSTRRGVVLLLAAVVLSAPLLAGDPQVAEAKSLFDNGAYMSSLTTLNGVDRSRLSADDAATYDRLLGVLPEAIRLSERGEQDKTNADAAFSARPLGRGGAPLPHRRGKSVRSRGIEGRVPHAAQQGTRTETVVRRREALRPGKGRRTGCRPAGNAGPDARARSST